MKGSCHCAGFIERADNGGERAGLICSLFGTAKFNGVNPEAWLRHVLARIADHWANRVDEFLPWHFAARFQRLETRRVPAV